jgi:hypothetical protein
MNEMSVPMSEIFILTIIIGMIIFVILDDHNNGASA